MKKKKGTEKNKTTLNKNHKKIIIIITIVIIFLGILIAVGSYLYWYNKKTTIKYSNEMQQILRQNNEAINDYQEEVANNTVWTYADLENKLINKSKLVPETKIKVTINGKSFKKDDTYTFSLGQTQIVIYLQKTYNYKIFTEKTELITSKKEIVINILDKEAPVIEGVKDITITVGEQLDLLKGITAKDAVDGDVPVNVEGKVDVSKAGTYQVKIYAIDKSGNRIEQEMTVTVKQKKTTASAPKVNSKSNASSGGCVYTSLLKKRGYNSSDPDACEKDRQASAIIKKIADNINAKGYSKDIEKVQAAAAIVAANYYQGRHVQSGYDYRTPYGVLVKGESSCAGCTRALIQVLEYLGFTNLKHVNENGYTHQWVILTMDGQKGFADGQVGEVGYGCHFIDGNCSE